MYSDINTLIRGEIAERPITYKGNELPHIWISDQHEENGAYVQVSTYLTDPQRTEIGFDANQTLTGFIQFLVKLPISDGGLNYSVNDIAQQYFKSYPSSSKVINGIKIEYNPTSRPLEGGEDGYYTVTVRVGFTVYYCL